MAVPRPAARPADHRVPPRRPPPPASVSTAGPDAAPPSSTWPPTYPQPSWPTFSTLPPPPRSAGCTTPPDSESTVSRRLADQLRAGCEHCGITMSDGTAELILANRINAVAGAAHHRPPRHAQLPRRRGDHRAGQRMRAGQRPLPAGVLTVARVVVELNPKFHPHGKRFLVKDYPKDKEWRRFVARVLVRSYSGAPYFGRKVVRGTRCTRLAGIQYASRDSEGYGRDPPSTLCHRCRPV